MEKDVTNHVMTQNSHIHRKIQILVTLSPVSGLQSQQTKACCISPCLVNVPSISFFHLNNLEATPSSEVERGKKKKISLVIQAAGKTSETRHSILVSQ